MIHLFFVALVYDGNWILAFQRLVVNTSVLTFLSEGLQFCSHGVFITFYGFEMLKYWKNIGDSSLPWMRKHDSDPSERPGPVELQTSVQAQRSAQCLIWMTRNYYKIIVMVLLIMNLINQGIRVQYFTKSLIARLLGVLCCPTNKDRKGWFKQNLTDQLPFFHLANWLINDIWTCWWLKKMKRGRGLRA